jgi:RNA polymerase sigma-70 factor, ECF subfamily
MDGREKNVNQQPVGALTLWRPTNSEELTLPVETHSNTDHATEIEKAFLEHHEMVYRAAFRITGNASDAEDVLQTLFLRLIRREWVADRVLGWPAYLHRAAVNIGLDIVRARTRQVDIGDSENLLHESRPDPYREYSASELRKWFSYGLAELNPAWAEIFILRYVEGYKVQEIASMLNSTKSTVAVTLFRTRSRLRKSMRKFLGGS